MFMISEKAGLKAMLCKIGLNSTGFFFWCFRVSIAGEVGRFVPLLIMLMKSDAFLIYLYYQSVPLCCTGCQMRENTINTCRSRIK